MKKLSVEHMRLKIMAKAEFNVTIEEINPRDPENLIIREGSVIIEAEQDIIDTIVEAIVAVPEIKLY